MLFVEKGKKKKIVETKLLQPDEQLLHIKILRALFHLAEQILVNENFEILNLVDHCWKVPEGKLESKWFERSVLSSIKATDYLLKVLCEGYFLVKL